MLDSEHYSEDAETCLRLLDEGDNKGSGRMKWEWIGMDEMRMDGRHQHINKMLPAGIRFAGFRAWLPALSARAELLLQVQPAVPSS